MWLFPMCGDHFVTLLMNDIQVFVKFRLEGHTSVPLSQVPHRINQSKSPAETLYLKVVFNKVLKQVSERLQETRDHRQSTGGLPERVESVCKCWERTTCTTDPRPQEA